MVVRGLDGKRYILTDPFLTSFYSLLFLSSAKRS